MSNKIYKYLIILAIFIIFDFLWLGLIAKETYRKYLGFLMRDKPYYFAAVVFYVIFAFGLMMFVINPAISKQSVIHALKWGALFGLVTYATYDLTNLATLKDWPIELTAIDLLWGTAVSALTSLLSYISINAIW